VQEPVLLGEPVACRSDISTLPGSTEVTSTPRVLIICWRSKLARTRASISPVVSATRRLCHLA
jgi:hypothetical protein